MLPPPSSDEASLAVSHPSFLNMGQGQRRRRREEGNHLFFPGRAPVFGYVCVSAAKAVNTAQLGGKDMMIALFVLVCRWK